MNYRKIGKSRYELTTDRDKFCIFKDYYTGLWRIRRDGGPIDWSGPFATLKEAKERLLASVE